jgi:hypothetical protein
LDHRRGVEFLKSDWRPQQRGVAGRFLGTWAFNKLQIGKSEHRLDQRWANDAHGQLLPHQMVRRFITYRTQPSVK